VEIRIRPTASRADEELSLRLYNEVWPRDAAAMDEVDSYKRSLRAFADLLAFRGDEPAASGFLAVLPQRPTFGHAMITVLPRHRRHGVGTRLYRELSRWCAERELEAMEARVEEDD
jgi:GNAT superfamily N-acetyltransferase